jgi:hypothetical protein
MCISSCYWKPEYLVWCLLSFGYWNAFDATSIMFSLNAYFDKCLEIVEVVLWHFHRSRSRVARCGSFAGKVFSLLVVSSRWTRGTRWFTWFGPSERNTLRPQENWVILYSSLSCLSIFFFLTSWKWRLSGPFIAQGRVVYNELPRPDRWPQG